ncbi:MAG TPA: hydratase [Pseudolabrys sp.]
MDTRSKTPDLAATAGEVIAALAERRQIQPFSARPGGLTLADAGRVQPLLRAAFEARGEKITGRKIGFTNRTMWPKYGVYAPNWGYVTSATTRDLAKTNALRCADFLEPLIEPEIMFGLKAAPAPDMDENALLDCIDWLSLGYEVVQSIYPGWKFAPADTTAANAQHGALLVGARHAVAPRKAQWLKELAACEIELLCGGQIILGQASNVLDSPLLALRHLVDMLAKDPHNPPLAAGEIVTTGSLTLAMPVAPGETWTAMVSGIPLEAVRLRFD